MSYHILIVNYDDKLVWEHLRINYLLGVQSDRIVGQSSVERKYYNRERLQCDIPFVLQSSYHDNSTTISQCIASPEKLLY